jgi:hypothetical protein
MKKDSENKILSCENKLQELKREASQLSEVETSLKNNLKQVSRNFERNLLMQIVILMVIALIISQYITNILGISSLGNYRLCGLFELNLAIAGSVVVLLVLINLILIGFKKK